MASIVSFKSSSDFRVPSDAEIRQILSERIDDQKALSPRFEPKRTVRPGVAPSHALSLGIDKIPA